MLYVGEGPRGSNGARSPLHRVSVFHSTTHNQTGSLCACSWVGGLVHALGPCGSLQRTLLWGWEFLLLLPQPPWVFSLRGLRLYFPALEPWVVWSSLLPLAVPPSLSMRECGATGSASGHTACPIHSTIRQAMAMQVLSALAACLCPSYRSGWMFLFYFLGVGLPCCSIICQFWLCEEAQCVYLCRHLGSLKLYFSMCLTDTYQLW